MSKFLFIAGPPRSGTSALTEMLNGHSQIALGMERYRNALSTGQLFEQGPRLFEEEKFFDWRPEETAVRVIGGKYAAMYEDLRPKYHPSFYAVTNPLFKTFPGAKMIIIWREMDAVAMSWQRRSEDKSAWPAKNDALAALKKAKTMLQQIMAAKSAYPGAIRLVRYEDVFRTADPTPSRIAEWLGLDPGDAAFQSKISAIRHEAEKLSANREPVYEIVTQAIARDSRLRDLTTRLHGLTTGSA